MLKNKLFDLANQLKISVPTDVQKDPNDILQYIIRFTSGRTNMRASGPTINYDSTQYLACLGSARDEDTKRKY